MTACMWGSMVRKQSARAQHTFPFCSVQGTEDPRLRMALLTSGNPIKKLLHRQAWKFLLGDARSCQIEDIKHHHFSLKYFLGSNQELGLCQLHHEVILYWIHPRIR